MCSAWNLKWHWNIFSCISIILAFLQQGMVWRNTEAFSLYIHLWLLFQYLELQIQLHIMMDVSLRVLAKRRTLNKAAMRAQDVKLKIECHSFKWWSGFPFDFYCSNGVYMASSSVASCVKSIPGMQNHNGSNSHVPC